MSSVHRKWLGHNELPVHRSSDALRRWRSSQSGSVSGSESESTSNVTLRARGSRQQVGCINGISTLCLNLGWVHSIPVTALIRRGLLFPDARDPPLTQLGGDHRRSGSAETKQGFAENSGQITRSQRQNPGCFAAGCWPGRRP